MRREVVPGDRGAFAERAGAERSPDRAGDGALDHLRGNVGGRAACRPEKRKGVGSSPPPSAGGWDEGQDFFGAV
jgi:hypothetical protein